MTVVVVVVQDGPTHPLFVVVVDELTSETKTFPSSQFTDLMKLLNCLAIINRTIPE